jgi:hypothetical protein
LELPALPLAYDTTVTSPGGIQILKGGQVPTFQD